MKNKKIIFMGTPEIAKTTLEKLINSKSYKPCLIVTQKDKAIGRKQILTPPPVKVLAEKNDIEVLQPENLTDEDFLKKIKELKPDLAVVLAYGKIVPKEFLEIPRLGTLNIHTSLLPKHRGASPIQNTILKGDKVSGVTLMQIDEKLDHGPILAQKELVLDQDETSETLHDKLAVLGADLLLETLPLWFEGVVEPKEQAHEKATFCTVLKREDGEIFPEKQGAEEIGRIIRAFIPWPGTYLSLKSKVESRKTRNDELKVKILDASIVNCKEESENNLYLSVDKKLILKTKKDCLWLKTVQPESKNKMSGEAFFAGYNKKSIN